MGVFLRFSVKEHIGYVRSSSCILYINNTTVKNIVKKEHANITYYNQRKNKNNA